MTSFQLHLWPPISITGRSDARNNGGIVPPKSPWVFVAFTRSFSSAKLIRVSSKSYPTCWSVSVRLSGIHSSIGFRCHLLHPVDIEVTGCSCYFYAGTSGALFLFSIGLGHRRFIPTSLYIPTSGNLGWCLQSFLKWKKGRSHGLHTSVLRYALFHLTRGGYSQSRGLAAAYINIMIPDVWGAREDLIVGDLVLPLEA